MSHENDLTSAPAVLNQKTAGVMIPLFSIRTTQNCGVGEILDLIPFMDWMADHHLRVVQLLPVYETAPEETSPYQALSSFAIDPVYLSLVPTEGFQIHSEIRGYLETEGIRSDIARWRESKTVDVKPVRALKYQILRLAFSRFKREAWDPQSDRALRFQGFMKAQCSWLKDYALFWQLKERHGWRHWHDWPEAYKTRDPGALSLFEQDAADGLLFIQYVQWVLWSQWQTVREHAKTREVRIMGDMPFLVSRDSADVWRDQHLFDQRISIGAPPDDFNADGQDWGLPVFFWHQMEAEDFRWWRLRMQEARQYYDLVRLDHVVGFFRIWVMPKGERPYFEPADEGAQLGRGKRLLEVILSELGACIPIAEDLGCVPDFVRHTLCDFHIAGHKVLRWEKRGNHYHPPKDYPFLALATTGTHDTSTLSTWWDTLSEEERTGFLDLLNHTEGLSAQSPMTTALHQAIMEMMLASGAALVIFPMQDLLMERGQINVPGTVGPHNWCYRMPALISALDQSPQYRARLASFKSAVKRFERDGSGHG